MKEIDFNKLKEPFEENEIEWRLSQCGETQKGFWGMCLAYINARAIMDRLDSVCGPENWKVKYEILQAGIIAKLSVKISNEWIEKEDGAEITDIEPFKGGISSALKRAANVWGIGRYLYSLDSTFVQIVSKETLGARYGKTKDNKVFYWLPPKLPEWALPKKNNSEKPISDQQQKFEIPQNNDHKRTGNYNGERARLFGEIMTESNRLSLTKDQIASLCLHDFGKKSTEMTDEDLFMFLQTLKKEIKK